MKVVALRPSNMLVYLRGWHHLGVSLHSTGFASHRPGFDSRFPLGSFSRSSHTSDLQTGAPVAALPGAWRHRVTARTGWPGVNIV